MSALGRVALAYAEKGRPVFPLNGKVPVIRNGHGVLDATTDPATIRRWWARWPTANIGGRVPNGIIVIDTDPRHDGEHNLRLLEEVHGQIPRTLVCYSGRGDGGRHLYYRHPGGKLTSQRLPDGIDLKDRGGYTVLPPSIHPDSRRPYWWDDTATPIADMPAWLVEILHNPPAPRPPFRPRPARLGESIADWFTNNTTWEQILGEARWTEVSGGWRHPNASSALSATIRHDKLFVYSSNTPFDVTEPGNPHGYTRFRAWATLHYSKDLHAAALAAENLKHPMGVPA